MKPITRIRDLPGFALLAVAVGASPTNAAAPFPDGVSALFAGHSFFAPVARDFDSIARANGYADHAADVVFSGGQSGSPGRLWENPTKRAEIIGHLDDGDIGLFGLTVYSAEDSAFDDYTRWFDEALAHNPDTQFFVGHPQTPQGAVTPSPLYDEITDALGEQSFQIVKQLRAAYPDNPVHFIHYGKVAAEMKQRYDAGELPDVRGLLPNAELMIGRDEALFKDVSPGHGGSMLIELGALSWMQLLYGADVDSLSYTDYESDVSGIVDEAAAFNQRFQAITLGDYNADGLVDAADYTVWRDAVGETGLGIGPDGNGDQAVDAADYELWVAQYGVTAAVAVPEPGSVAICIALAMVAQCRRR